MRITATRIENWADTRDAQGILPVLIRRLISATTETNSLVMPGGASIGSPGWDGYVCASKGNPWVPVGPSFWEMGCGSDATKKARADFNKRCQEITTEAAREAAYVFVSPRRWPRKVLWKEEALSRALWADVRAYDADDIEAWLEIAPGVALWFGEILGVSGGGISSVSKYWANWSNQTRPPITTEVLLAGRESERSEFNKAISQKNTLVAIEADSREEAVAFACAELIELALHDVSGCVSSADGWRIFDMNNELKIGIASSPEIAAHQAPRDGATMIIPLSAGDRPEHFFGSAAKAADSARIVLKRLKSDQFEKALRSLGEEPSDAARFTRSTGRSWSVYRRMRATNPSIRHPAWLSQQGSECLSAIMLVGCWDGSRSGDRACLEAISGKSYPELETDLHKISLLDDSPLLQIGAVWKAKAPIDLLYNFGPKLTAAEISRFFSVANAILAKPDPSLEVEEDHRWMAAVYGKVREESGLVIDSIVDSLAKLRVYAESTQSHNSTLIMSGVDGLIHDLLSDASKERWLSLADCLRELAEASPNEFLAAVEKSLKRADAPVRGLLNETSNSGIGGRCWHSGLLWALEILAWYPQRLARVADILAQLADTPIKGNWGNTPKATLSSFFRPWWPQTNATVDERLSVIDRLIKKSNSIAWTLLFSLLPRHGGSAIANAKPRWRDDDAGHSETVDGAEYGRYISELGRRVIDQAKGHPQRIADLVSVLDSFGGDYKENIIDLVEGSSVFSDEERELIRESVRKYLSWHNSYNLEGERKDRSAVERLREQFDVLASSDPVRRHTWVFAADWLELPDGKEDDHEAHCKAIQSLQKQALGEILRSDGLPGLNRLIKGGANPWTIGRQAANSYLDESALFKWVLENFEDGESRPHQELVRAVLYALPSEKHISWIQKVAELSTDGAEKVDKVASFIASAPCEASIWQFLKSMPNHVQEAYWKLARPGYSKMKAADLSFLIGKFIEVGRHRTAFQVIQSNFGVAQAFQVYELLNGIRMGADPEGPMPDSWRIETAINFIEKSGALSRREVAMLEFAYFRALEHGKNGARNLFSEVLSDPNLFIELICLVYKPRSGEFEETSDSVKAAAELAFSVLHAGRGVPGHKDDNTVDSDEFTKWVTCARQLAREMDRADVADVTLGEWISKCPGDLDGTWPCLVVRELLDQPDAEKIRKGFSSGLFNNRGVITRAYYEGGAQERDLAGRYRRFAEPLHNTHPQVAALLVEIAESYESYAYHEDLDAQLRIEGH